MKVWIAGIVAAFGTVGAVAAQDAENGASVFRTHCAVCRNRSVATVVILP